MNDLIHEMGREHIMFAILGLAVLIALWTLSRRSKDAKSSFSFDQLLTQNGETSPAACLLFGSFAATTWLLIFLTATGKITEGYFGLYLTAWVSPAVAKIIKGEYPITKSTMTSTSVTVEK